MGIKLRPARVAETAPEQDGYYDVLPVKSKEMGGAGVGGLYATDQKMKMPAKIPCRECPLRRDSAKGYLGGYTPEMYLHVLHGPASVACHCSKGFHDRNISQQRHCTGVAGYRLNVGVQSGSGADAAAAAMANYPRDVKEDFFTSPSEFYHHHKAAQDEALRKRAKGGETPATYPQDWGHNQEEDIS